MLEELFQRPPGLGIGQQALLQLPDLLHQLPRLRLLRYLQEHRLRGRGDDHLGLLPQQFDPLAAEAGPRILAMAELGA